MIRQVKHRIERHEARPARAMLDDRDAAVVHVDAARLVRRKAEQAGKVNAGEHTMADDEDRLTGMTMKNLSESHRRPALDVGEGLALGVAVFAGTLHEP